MSGRGATHTAVTTLEFGSKTERKGLNWMGASLSGVLGKWGVAEQWKEV